MRLILLPIDSDYLLTCVCMRSNYVKSFSDCAVRFFSILSNLLFNLFSRSFRSSLTLFLVFGAVSVAFYISLAWTKSSSFTNKRNCVTGSGMLFHLSGMCGPNFLPATMNKSPLKSLVECPPLVPWLCSFDITEGLRFGDGLPPPVDKPEY